MIERWRAPEGQPITPGAVPITVTFTLALFAAAGFAGWAVGEERRADDELARRGIEVSAVVTRVQRSTTGSREVEVRYVVGGQERRRTVKGSEPVGAVVRMLADPGGRRHDRRADQPRDPGALGVLAAFVALMAVAMAFVARRERRKQQHALAMARRGRWAPVVFAWGRAPPRPPAPEPLPLSRQVGLFLPATLAALPVGAWLLGVLLGRQLSGLRWYVAASGVLLVVGAVSRVRVSGDGVLTQRLYLRTTSVDLGRLSEVGGRPHPDLGRSMHPLPYLTETLLLRDDRGGHVVLNPGMWNGGDQLIDQIRSAVVARQVPTAGPAAALLYVRECPDVVPDLRWGLLPAVPLLVMGAVVAMMIVLE